MKLMITIFLIHKILDIATAADTNSSSGSNNNNSSGLKISIIVVSSIVGIFVIGTCLYCLCCRRKSTKKRRVGASSSRDVKEKKPRSRGGASSTSKGSVEKERLMPGLDTRLTVIQPSGTTTPSRVPPQTPLTPPQPQHPQHTVIPPSTQSTLTKVSESLEMSQPTRKTSTEIEIPEEYTSHRPRPHSTIEQRDDLPQSRSSTDLSSRFSLPPTIQTYGQQHQETQDFYPERTQSVESHLEQATRSRDTSPYRQYHPEYESQPFDTPLQTQSRGMDSSLFTDAPNLPYSQQSFETSTDDPGEVYQELGPTQRQRASMPPYPVPQPPYDDSSIPSTPPERRGRPESTYSFDDNPGSALPGRPLQRSTPGTSPRSRRGRRGGNR